MMDAGRYDMAAAIAIVSAVAGVGLVLVLLVHRIVRGRK